MTELPFNPIHSPCDTPLEGEVFVDVPRDDDVSRLTWDLIDESLDDAGRKRLEGVLRQSAAARKQYVEIMQLHFDLRDTFGGQPPIELVED